MTRRKLPARGPRVMPGAARLLAMARDLGGSFVPRAVEQSTSSAKGGGKSVTDVAAALAMRLEAAEMKVARMLRAVDLFEAQVHNLPAEHEFRKGAQQIFDNLRQQCTAVDEHISRKGQP